MDVVKGNQMAHSKTLDEKWEVGPESPRKTVRKELVLSVRAHGKNPTET